ncbi:MAG: CbiX/SirB N-terminal domain-containing protein [Candidatus Helarchaeota archaeon]
MKNHIIILVAHGSQLDYNKQLLFHLKSQLESEFPHLNLKGAFLNFNNPPLSIVVEESIKEGYETISIIPIFLALGVHLLQDIPKILGLPENERSGIIKWHDKSIKIQILEPLGSDTRIFQILSDKIRKLE